MGRAEALEEHLMKKRCVFHVDGKERRKRYREECPGFCDQQELDQYMRAFDEMENEGGELCTRQGAYRASALIRSHSI